MGPTRAICNSGQCEATPSDANGKPVLVLDEQRCLPASVCSAWKGCAAVTGNAQDGYVVLEAEAVPKGEPASVGNVCSAPGVKCEAAVAQPRGVTCPPQTTPLLTSPPPFSCAVDKAGHCRSEMR